MNYNLTINQKKQQYPVLLVSGLRPSTYNRYYCPTCLTNNTGYCCFFWFIIYDYKGILIFQKDLSILQYDVISRYSLLNISITRPLVYAVTANMLYCTFYGHPFCKRANIILHRLILY